MNCALGRSVGTLSERLTDLEQTVQSQRTTPVTEASAPQVFLKREGPSVKTSREELTRGVVITYVDDLLLTGWQHHIDAINQALLVKYVMTKSGLLPYCVQGGSANGSSEGIDFFLGARITRDADGTVWCDQSKYIQHCLRENGFYDKDGRPALRKAHAPPTVDEKLGEEEGSKKRMMPWQGVESILVR